MYDSLSEGLAYMHIFNELFKSHFSLDRINDPRESVKPLEFSLDACNYHLPRTSVHIPRVSRTNCFPMHTYGNTPKSTMHLLA